MRLGATQDDILRTTLVNAFSWAMTPEGGDYWRKLYHEYIGVVIGDLPEPYRERAIQRAQESVASMEARMRGERMVMEEDDQIIK